MWNRLLSTVCATALLWPIALLPAARAQAIGVGTAPGLEMGIRYATTRANSPPGSCGCFLLQGAGLDAGLPIRGAWSAAVEVGGSHAANVPGTARQLSVITLLAGPRYTVALGHRHQVFAQSLFGAARGFDAEFRRGNDAIDTATAFAFAVGGAYQFRLSSALALRPLQVEMLQTNLPNGAEGRQRNLRVGAGVSLTLPLGTARR